MGLRQISCSLQNPTGLIRAIRDIRVRLSLQQQRPRSLIRVIRDITSRWSVGLRQISCSFKSTATETSASYSCHSRYSCSLNHSSNRDNRPIRVRFALLLLVDLWVYDKSRVRLPYTNFSPLFICTSFTNFLTSADESSFLHINSTLSSSATI